MAGPVIGGYSDLVEVGEGGFAVVYRALQDRVRRLVAVKVLKAKGLDAGDRRRFEVECEMMGALSWHPHVVALFDSGFTGDGRPYLVMEYLEKGSLADRVAASGALGWIAGVDAGVQAAGALGAVHAAGRVHRDVKPENLMVGPFDEVKLSDFGIASVSDASRRSSKASFTPHYVAPEVLRGHRADERSDVYSLAASLHCLIGGRPPFGQDGDEDIATVLLRVVEGDPPRLEDVPDQLADLLLAGLAKSPDDRPQTVAELGSALQAVQAREGVEITPLRVTPEPTAGPALPEHPDAGPVPGASVAAPNPPAGEHAGPLPVGGDPEATVQFRDPTMAPPSAPITPGRPPPPPPPPVAPRSPGPAVARAPLPFAAVPVPPVPVRRWRRPAFVAFGIAAVLAIVVLLAAGLALSNKDNQGAAILAGEDPRAVQTIDVGVGPAAVAASDTDIWVANSIDGTVSRVDAHTGTVTDTIDVGNGPTSVAASDTDIWVANSIDGTVSRVDAHTGTVTDTIDVGNTPTGIAVSGTDLWIANSHDNTVSRLDTRTGTITDTIDVGVLPFGVAVAGTDVWITNRDDNTVTRLDASTGTITDTIDVGNGPSGLVATDSDIWVANSSDGTMSRIETSSGRVTDTIDVGDDPVGAAVSGSDVWVTNRDDDTVSRLDASTGTITDTVNVGNSPVSVAVSDTDVWVANVDDFTVTRIT